MKEWKTFFAVLMTGALVAVGPAWAQTSGTTSQTPSSTNGTSGTSGTSATAPSESGTAAKPGRRAGRASRMSSAQVKAIQQALKDKGHDPGPIDGRMGPKTHAALKDFQKAEGLKVTGRPDSETMAKLGVESKTGQAGTTTSPSASPSTSPSGSATSSPSGTSAPSATAPGTGGTSGGSMGSNSTSGGSSSTRK